MPENEDQESKKSSSQSEQENDGNSIEIENQGGRKEELLSAIEEDFSKRQRNELQNLGVSDENKNGVNSELIKSEAKLTVETQKSSDNVSLSGTVGESKSPQKNLVQNTMSWFTKTVGDQKDDDLEDTRYSIRTPDSNYQPKKIQFSKLYLQKEMRNFTSNFLI